MKRREFLVALAATALAPASGWAAPAGLRLKAEPVTARLLPEGQGVTRMLGFNGSTPGPEIRARKGGRVAVAFENGIDSASAIHWHGIHIENAMDGVPGLTQAAVEPGEMFDYAFDASHSGTYWYHSHERSWEQVAKGLYGPLIIEERDPPRVDHDITVVLDDWRLTRSGELHPNFGNRHDFSHDGRLGNFARALASREAVRRGDRVRLRLINTATARIFPVRISGGAGKVVAHDGMPLAAPEPLGELVLAPAQRTDVILDVAGSVTFSLLTRREPYELGKIEAEGANPTPIKTPIAPLPPHAAPAPDRKKARRLTLAMQGGAMGGRHGGKDFWALQRLFRLALCALAALRARRDGADHDAERHRLPARHPHPRPPLPRTRRGRRARPLPRHHPGRPAPAAGRPLRVRQPRQVADPLPYPGPPGVGHEDLGRGRLTGVLPANAQVPEAGPTGACAG